MDVESTIGITDPDYSGCAYWGVVTRSIVDTLLSIRFTVLERLVLFSICLMLRVVCCKRGIPLKSCRSIERSFSRHSKYPIESISPKRRVYPYVLGIGVLAMGGAGIYLYETNSFKMMEFTKRIKDESNDEMKWRDAIATSLVAMSNQDQGKERLLRHKWGTTLGNWIIEDSVSEM